jgi:hypothetical protein
VHKDFIFLELNLLHKTFVQVIKILLWNTFIKEIIVSILTITGLRNLLGIEPNMGLNIMNSICKDQLHGNKFANLGLNIMNSICKDQLHGNKFANLV